MIMKAVWARLRRSSGHMWLPGLRLPTSNVPIPQQKLQRWAQQVLHCLSGGLTTASNTDHGTEPCVHLRLEPLLTCSRGCSNPPVVLPSTAGSVVPALALLSSLCCISARLCLRFSSCVCQTAVTAGVQQQLQTCIYLSFSTQRLRVFIFLSWYNVGVFPFFPFVSFIQCGHRCSMACRCHGDLTLILLRGLEVKRFHLATSF